MEFIKEDFFVRISYHLELKNEKAPSWFSNNVEVSFVLGREPVPSLIENAIKNKKVGEEIEITIPPESAFGPHLSHLVKEIETKNLKYPEKIIPGEWYEELNSYGGKLCFKVLEVKGNKVIADFNHPAAGKTVIMKIKILEARPATSFEILSAELRGGGCGT